MSRGAPPIETVLRLAYKKSGKYILGVSGGIDSVVLLTLSAHLAKSLNLSLAVAHVNHNLRPESGGDADFVEKLAIAFGLSFYLCNAKPPKIKVGLEAWGRVVRYDFFTKLRKKLSFDGIVTAHHADDVAETFLMKLLRNKDLATIQASDESRFLVRPLLEVPRKAIAEYALKNGLQWREDPSNEDERFLRNQIRHSVIPYLVENCEPRIVEVLARRSHLLEEDLATLQMLADEVTCGLLPIKSGSHEWTKRARKILEPLPKALQRRVVQHLTMPILDYKLGLYRCDAVVQVILGQLKGIELEGGVRIYRQRGSVVFDPKKPSKKGKLAVK